MPFPLDSAPATTSVRRRSAAARRAPKASGDFKATLARALGATTGTAAARPGFRATLARDAAATVATTATARAGGTAARSSAAALALRPAAAPRTGAGLGGGAVDNAAFRERIAIAERSAEHPGGGYTQRNPASGALGRYQMLTIALRDLGWREAGGGWTALAARHGVRSEADFLANPAAQEAAMGAYLARVETLLGRHGALEAAGRVLAGTDGAAVPVTEAGLVAAAHRRGAAAVARYLAHRTRTPDAPVPAESRAAFAQVERRLREFAGVAYVAAAPSGGAARAV